MPNSGLNVITATHPTGESGEVPSQAGGTLSIRELHQRDLPAVVAVEQRSFANPWSLGMFALELSRPAGVFLAADVEGQIAGCAIAGRYGSVWHLMKIAVAPEQRRRGHASRLLSAVLERIDPEEPVTLEVRPTNVAAITLYERFGFVALGRRSGYYPDNGEDALVMWRGDPARAGIPVESLDPAA